MTKAITKTNGNKAINKSKKVSRSGKQQLATKTVTNYFSNANVAKAEWPVFITKQQLATKSFDSIGWAVDNFVTQAVNGLPDTAQLCRELQRLSDKYQRHNAVDGYEAAAYTWHHAANCFVAYRPESQRQVKAMVKSGYDIGTALEILTQLAPVSQLFVKACRMARSSAKAAGKKAAKAAAAKAAE